MEAHHRTSSSPAARSVDTATAPLQVEIVFDLHTTPGEAFDLVSNRLPEWFSQVHAVRWDHSRSASGPRTLGACSERTCDFDGKSLVEEIVEVTPGASYRYRVDMARSEMKMPLRDHLGVFEVTPAAEGARVRWAQHFRAAWFVPSAMLRWQMRDKLMLPAIDALVARRGGGVVSVR